MLVEPLDLSTPMACFNGAVLVSRALTSTREYLLPPGYCRAGDRFPR